MKNKTKINGTKNRTIITRTITDKNDKALTWYLRVDEHYCRVCSGLNMVVVVAAVNGIIGREHHGSCLFGAIDDLFHNHLY